MAFSVDAMHGGRFPYPGPRGFAWPREFLTLAIVCGLVVFWTLVLLVTGII